MAHRVNRLFIPIQAKLAGAILHLIEDQRNRNDIDENLVKKVGDSFVSLSLDGIDINKEGLGFYKEHFELPFVDATEIYYKKEAEIFLVSHSLSDYPKKGEECLRRGEDRVDCYLNGQTR